MYTHVFTVYLVVEQTPNPVPTHQVIGAHNPRYTQPIEHQGKVFIPSSLRRLCMSANSLWSVSTKSWCKKLLPFGQGHSTPKVYMRLIQGLNQTGENAATGRPLYPLPITPTVQNTEGFYC